MIHEVAFLNFRGIRKGRLPLFPLTVLLGANNSGKTTVLEALYLLRSEDIMAASTYVKIIDGKEKPLSVVEVLHEYHALLESSGYKFLVRNYDGEARVACKTDEEFIGCVFKCGEPGVRVFRVQAKTDTYPDVSTFLRKGIDEEIEKRGRLPALGGVLLKDVGVIVGFESTPARCLFVKPQTINLAANFLKSLWYLLRKRSLPTKVAREISELVSEGYITLALEPHIGGGSTLLAILEDGSAVRLSDLGDGMRVLAMTMLLWELLKADLLLWDDIEAFMNPSTLLYVADWVASLVKGGAQAVVATHSLEAAKLLLREAEEAGIKARAILLGLWDGELRHRVLTLDELERLKAAGVDVRMAGGFLL